MMDLAAASSVLKALIQSAPHIAKEVREFADIHGIDLGPAPPDLKAHVAADRADIDARRAAKREQEESAIRGAFPIQDDPDSTEDPDDG